MAVNLHDPNQRLALVDANAAARRDTGAEVPAAGTAQARAAATGAPTTRGAAATAPVDRTERVASTQANDELRAMLDAPPPLPSSGAHVLSRNERNALGDFLERTHDGDGALMWDALATMVKSSQNDASTANELKNAMQLGKVNSKKADIRTNEGQNADDRRSSAMQVGISVVALAASYGAYKYGSSQTADSSVESQRAAQSTGAAFAQSANSVVSATGAYINKVAGPQAEADKKKILSMRHQVMQEVFEQGIENAKGNYDEAREQMKLALKILTEHSERATQISTTITRI